MDLVARRKYHCRHDACEQKKESQKYLKNSPPITTGVGC
jgi:hypothetical protein